MLEYVYLFIALGVSDKSFEGNYTVEKEEDIFRCPHRVLGCLPSAKTTRRVCCDFLRKHHLTYLQDGGVENGCRIWRQMLL